MLATAFAVDLTSSKTRRTTHVGTSSSSVHTSMPRSVRNNVGSERTARPIAMAWRIRSHAYAPNRQLPWARFASGSPWGRRVSGWRASLVKCMTIPRSGAPSIGASRTVRTASRTSTQLAEGAVRTSIEANLAPVASIRAAAWTRAPQPRPARNGAIRRKCLWNQSSPAVPGSWVTCRNVRPRIRMYCQNTRSKKLSPGWSSMCRIARARKRVSGRAAPRPSQRPRGSRCRTSSIVFGPSGPGLPDSRRRTPRTTGAGCGPRPSASAARAARRLLRSSRAAMIRPPSQVEKSAAVPSSTRHKYAANRRRARAAAANHRRYDLAEPYGTVPALPSPAAAGSSPATRVIRLVHSQLKLIAAPACRCTSAKSSSRIRSSSGTARITASAPGSRTPSRAAAAAIRRSAGMARESHLQRSASTSIGRSSVVRSTGVPVRMSSRSDAASASKRTSRSGLSDRARHRASRTQTSAASDIPPDRTRRCSSRPSRPSQRARLTSSGTPRNRP